MNKKNLNLGIILIVLILGTWLFTGPIKDWKADWGSPKNFFAGLDFVQINQIEITEGDETMKLVLTDNRWLIDGTKGFYVEDNTAELIKTALEKARDGAVELAGENPEKKNDFGTDESGATVKLRQGENVLYEFVQGKANGDFTGSYFSPVGQDKTFLAAANLNNAFIRTDWYDKTIFAIEPDKINKIRFQYPDLEFTIEKKADSVKSTEDETLYFWEGTAPYQFRVDEEKINEVISVMTNLEASSIPGQSFEGTGLEQNLIIVAASGEDEISNTIMVGISPNEEAETVEYYAKRGDSDNIYLISKETRDKLQTSIRELR